MRTARRLCWFALLSAADLCDFLANEVKPKPVRKPTRPKPVIVLHVPEAKP